MNHISPVPFSLRRARVALAVGLMLALWAGEAGATCGSANCFLVNGRGDSVVEPGQTLADLSYRYIPQDVKRRGGDSATEVLVPRVDFENGVLIPDHHREHRTVNMLAQLDVVYGLTPDLTLAVAIPFLNDRLHEHDDDVDLSATPPDPGTFTNDDGTAGFGDVAVSLRYAFHGGPRHLLVAGLGVKLPTGEYKLRDGEGRINEPTLMPGSGSWDYLLSALFTYQVVPHALDGFLAAGYRVNTENDLDYERGDAVTAGAGLTWATTERVTLTGQLNYRRAARDDFKGIAVPSTGNWSLYLTPGIRLALGEATSIYSHVQVPLRQHVNEVNLVPDYALQMGVTRSF